MSDLKLNPDGTITIPLRPVIGAEGKRSRDVVLPEPSMLQLARMHSIVHDADESLPSVITIGDPEAATDEDLRAATDRLTERTMKTYSEEMPYGNAVVEIIKLLVPDSTVTTDDLPGWCANPNTCRRMLTHFQTPLAG